VPVATQPQDLAAIADPMSTAKKLGTSLVSAISLAILGIVPTVIAGFMFATMFVPQTITDKSGRSVTVTGGGTGFMVLVAGFFGFVGLFLLGGAAYTVYWGLTRSKEEDDPDRDSWKDMPYPKD
jgi:hypothetical protein